MLCIIGLISVFSVYMVVIVIMLVLIKCICVCYIFVLNVESVLFVGIGVMDVRYGMVIF